MNVFPPFFIESSLFRREKFKSDVHFHQPCQENLNNPKKIPDYPEYQIRRQGFLKAGCDGTRSAPSTLHFVPHCLQSALSRITNLCFGQEKLINSTLSAAGDNNTLELISN